MLDSNWLTGDVEYSIGDLQRHTVETEMCRRSLNSSKTKGCFYKAWNRPLSLEHTYFAQVRLCSLIMLYLPQRWCQSKAMIDAYTGEIKPRWVHQSVVDVGYIAILNKQHASIWGTDFVLALHCRYNSNRFRNEVGISFSTLVKSTLQ